MIADPLHGSTRMEGKETRENKFFAEKGVAAYTNHKPG